MPATKNNALQVSSVRCTELPDDFVYKITMYNGGVTVELTNLGATVTAILCPDRNGDTRNVVAGYKNLTDYKSNPHYYGCILGRYAGRIGKSEFVMEGKRYALSSNDGCHHLHGGHAGFNKKVWMIRSLIQDDEEVGVVMEYLSRHNEEGYPGNLWVKVKYSLDRHNNFRIDYSAVSDHITPISLSNHSYFNLSGFEIPAVTGHLLQLRASAYTGKQDDHLPTGTIYPVSGTPLDFTNQRAIGEDIESFPADGGYNHNFILDNHPLGIAQPAAILFEPQSGRRLSVYTDQPCVHVYTANDWTGAVTGPQGYPYQRHGAVAIETQAYPDAPNQAAFPDAWLRPGENYRTTTIFKFDYNS